MNFFNRILFVSSLLISNTVFANSLIVTDAYLRATPPHAANSAAFMTINNDSAATVNLIAASSDVAARVELHTHTLEDGLMKMRQVEQIEIKAHQQVALQPGGYHVMFIGLKQSLEEGKFVKLTLHFDNETTVVLELPIKKVTMSKH